MKRPLQLLAVGVFLLTLTFSVLDPERWWRYFLSAVVLGAIVWMAVQYGKAGGTNLPS